MGASVGSTLFQVQYDTQLEASGLNFWFANGPASNNRYFKGNGTMTCATTGTAVTGTGSFISSITALIPNTTYYLRAYASNSSGTAYGNEVSFPTLFCVW